MTRYVLRELWRAGESMARLLVAVAQLLARLVSDAAKRA
jgi:hypothetical protein